jgi:hypothetical protein
VVNTTSITATTPPGTAGDASVEVTTTLGGTNAANTLFTYAAVPTVTGISPTSGSFAGGTAITISGTGFTTAAAVTIGGTAATNVTVVSSTSITAITPAHPAGTASVLVTTAGGTNVPNTLFTYNAAAAAAVPAPAVPFSPAFPHALSITTGSGVVADSASFTVTFNQPVAGVDAADFTLVATGTVANGTISSVTGSGATYTVNVTGITGTGTLGVNLVDLPTITALPSFAAQSTFATGTNTSPNSVTLGDVNGDGILDMVTANGTANNVSVLLGNGNGAFATARNYATGNGPTSVTLGDVNRDGILDIITANGGTSNASVLLGLGNGTFGTAVNYATGLSPSSVTLGDVNRDGILDMVTANGTSSDVSVLVGIGNGSFTTAVNYSTGVAPRGVAPSSVTLGDLNRDGILDIITANEGSNDVSVLRGNANGTFGTAVNHSTGDGPSSVTLGDVNGDGVLDIITANRNSDTASVLLGNGMAPGDFGPATNFATLDTRNSIAVLDFDDTTDKSAIFVSVCPQGANLASGLSITLIWTASTATSGACVWDASLERMTTDIDTDSFDTAASITATTNATSGVPNYSTITLTTIDSLTAGDGFRLKINRDANNVSDTMTGDAELIAVEVRSAA